MSPHTGRNAAGAGVLLLLLASPMFAFNLVTNPSFNGNLTGWNLNPSTTFDSSNDATGMPGSGSARLAFAAGGASTTVAVDQCITTGPGTYTLGGKVLIPNGQSVGGSGIITVSFFSGGNCTTGLLFFDSLSTSATGSFVTLSKSTTAPAGTTNAWVTGQNSAAGAGTHTVNYDDFVFDNGLAPIVPGGAPTLGPFGLLVTTIALAGLALVALRQRG
jgi:hypothetical protein